MNQGDKAYLDEMKSGIHARQEAQADMLNRFIIPKLDEIVNHVKETNGRVTELEKTSINREAICGAVQDGKTSYKWYYLAGIVAASVLAVFIIEYGLLPVLDVLKGAP